MLRFLVRRILGAIAVLFAISVLVFLIFNVVPATNPAARIAGKNATPQLIKNVEEEWGFDKSAAGAVLDPDEADLHRQGRRPTPVPHQRRQADPRRHPGDRLALHRRGDHLARLRLPVRLLIRGQGGRLARPRADRAGPDRDLDAGLLARLDPPLLLHLQDRTLPGERVRTAVRSGRVGQPPDPALDQPRRPLRRLLQPRAALLDARRDERGLRAHGPRQGAQPAPGDDQARAAQLADPGDHPVRPRLRRR